MVAAGELSAAKATVDPTQDVLSTSELVISVQLIPVGVAHTIIINVGFTTQIS